MDDDLKLPEDDGIDLQLDDLPAVEELPSLPEEEDGADFNLDDFLSSDDGAEPLPELAATDADAETLTVEPFVTEPELEPEPFITEPELEAEPFITETEPEAEAVPQFEPASEPASEPEPEPEPEPELDASLMEEETVSTDLPDVPEKGWAFEGLAQEASEPEIAAEVPVENVPVFEVEAEPLAQETPEPEVMADEPQAAEVAEADNGYDMETTPNFVVWYSGERDEPAFEVGKDSSSQALEGDDERSVIHINVGFDTYGWQVQFANGISMNLSDVREYQLRNGSLPLDEGVIVFGEMQISFRHIRKITIYETVQYFTYA